MIQDAPKPEKKAEASKPEEKVVKVESERPSQDEISNTNAWAHADQTHKKEANLEESEMNMQAMSKEQKS